jgi:hypothetical protein
MHKGGGLVGAKNPNLPGLGFGQQSAGGLCIVERGPD